MRARCGTDQNADRFPTSSRCPSRRKRSCICTSPRASDGKGWGFPRAQAWRLVQLRKEVCDCYALVSDGTYRLTRSGAADATLLITLEAIDYQQVRSSTVDVLRSEELQLRVTVSYKLTDNNRPGIVIDAGRERGDSRLFVDDNLQTARMNALPDALQRATQSIIARLSDGI